MSNAVNLIFFLGRPLSPLYSALMKSREKLYQRGVFRRSSLPVPVIAIGNLVLGGTGKTPTVQHLAGLLLNNGYRPAIISRGYGGKSKESVNVVSDRQHLLLSPQLAGDEPCMLAQALPGVAVLTGARRIFPCHYAIDQLQADVLILDDGFQHLAVNRDIDIVLFDSTVLAGNSRVFPGGPLREPVSALNRCHAFLLTGVTAANRLRTEKFVALLHQRFPGKPVYMSCLGGYQLHDLKGVIARESLPGTFFAFCGIANPTRFTSSLDDFGIHPTGFQTFKDHTPYSQAIVDRLCQKAVASGADYLITTEKDSVKLKNLAPGLPLFTLKVDHQIDPALDLFILDALKRRPLSVPNNP